MTDLRTRALIYARGLLRRCARASDVPEGYAPSFAQYKAWAAENDEPSPDIIQNRLGKAFGVRANRAKASPEYRLNWVPLVRECGLRPISEAPTVDAALCRESVILVARALAEAGDLPPSTLPTRDQHDASPERLVDSSTVYKYLAVSPIDAPRGGNWNDVARECGLRPQRATYGARTRAEVVEDYRELSIEAGFEVGGHGLTAREFEDAAGYYFSKRWGTIAEIMREAGFEPRPAPENFAA